MDLELQQDIEQLVAKNANLRFLSDEEAASHLQRLQDTFIAEPSSTWWWESLKVPSRTVAYESEDGLDSLTTLLRAENGKVILTVTDDDPPPWLSVEGDKDALLTLIGELRFFEYFMSDPSGRWIVFDTHHNQLVMAGEITDTPGLL